MKEKLSHEWDRILLSENSSPYVFRTRLERVLAHTIVYADSISDKILREKCNAITNKLLYISDQSNQTSEGFLRSFAILKEDMQGIKACL